MSMSEEQRRMYNELVGVVVKYTPRRKEFKEKFKDYLYTLGLFIVNSLGVIAHSLDVEPDTPEFEEFMQTLRQDLVFRLTHTDEMVEDLLKKIRRMQF